MAHTTSRRQLIPAASWCAFLYVLWVLSFFGVSAAASTSEQSGAAEGGAQSSVRVGKLKTEHLSEPLGIQTPRPRFRWLMDSTERGQLQAAYQILVATSLEKLQADTGDKWDS